MKADNQDVKFIVALCIVISLVGGILGGIVFSSSNNTGNNFFNAGTSKTENVQVSVTSGITEVVNKVSPAVVSITSEHLTRGFWGPYTSKSSGTGFVVTAEGLVITNKHVVEDANASYSVFTNDGTEYPAKVKAQDPLSDIAFLQMEKANDLKTIDLGDSDELQVGEPVIAIGNALGQYQNSVTTGIVSGVGRALPVGDSESGQVNSLDNVIQTDAAINPGNSGGPLVNIRGQVIGINTAIDQSGQNIGFAIPINSVKTALKSVQSTGKVIRPIIGISYISITKDLAKKNNLSVNEGALVYVSGNSPALKPGSPAEKAGIKENDIITKINDTKIDAKHSLSSTVREHSVGETIKITLIRDSKEMKVDVKLEELKQ
ncbi:TPA: hypothetical protein DDW69_01480 [candidate division CPR2 bacterium]|uniref:Protease Do n=1 Tax=candidate division CPR2 bacterium GW2011_GWC1_41_48 TaxID=1618344 RepID=A0A0G0Z9I3_UNCC2|nr:MAG: protease Do [candidate division CPR2 bacterium GW2011_GWC2_39_35]KKR27863.1 MAG: protease Do [candidate division CPR2 bacterium GW2011_GWD2_39_7]KKR28733.1 MAG: protease Do [candidate division CPR2 bacterium GW2011_GWD1_39_7]KKS09693.1 MAG: protease Do [candidate division CPR2 bacterium GW2011_GWC1_41_48]OGB61379.1 MAG: hypothetical protein A2Y27_02020 [candidate division CPR2 bacterium GWD1_39_7]OGB71961.1 MAG: hypothetical protein A2Y26_01555 [candidate division CPR2 bacterium GWD2_3